MIRNYIANNLPKQIFLLWIGLFCGGLVSAQNTAPIGSWTSYSSHHYPSELIKRGQEIYVTTRGGLYTLDYGTFEMTPYSSVDGLSGNNASTIHYDEANDLVFLGFADGMINFFSSLDNISFISDIARSDQFTSKGINQMYAHQGVLYVATQFGVVAYDIDRKETRSSFTKIGNNNTGTEVLSLTVFEDSLWVTLEDSGLYAAGINHPNLADPAAWNRITGTDLPFGRGRGVTSTPDYLYAQVADTLFRRPVGGAWERAPVPEEPYAYLSSHDDIVYAAYLTELQIIYPGDSVVVVDNGGRQVSALVHDDFVWVGDRDVGLLLFKGGSFTKFIPNSPRNNFVSRIIPGDNEIYIAPKGRNGSYRHFDQSGIFYYSRTDGWTNVNRREQNLGDKIYRDFYSGVYDPNTDICYMASCGEGIVAMRDADTLRSRNSVEDNLLGNRDSFPQDVRITDMTLDSRGNLWMVTVYDDADRSLQVKTPNDEWYNYKLSGSRAIRLIVDDFDNKWIVNEKGGIYVFNDNGTLDLTSDDQLRLLTTGIGNGDLPSIDVLAIAKDLNGHIWVGTTDGVGVFYDPFSIFTSSSFTDASCPVFQNQCLMKSQKVNDIEVDGANRKWIATDQGVYLIEEDGTEQIYHFTSENSPLFSDIVVDIAIDKQTGEVFMGTSEGVVGYMGDAIAGRDNSAEVYAFPNPVLPDYTGPITIRGTVGEAVVKITNASGMLVREIESNGGQAVWDGRDQWGNRVKSGVYVIMVANRDGEKEGVTKVAFVQRN